MKISAEPGEAIDKFADRMTTLRDHTDEDFVAVHNEREVTVTREIGPRKFMEAWDEAGGVFALANVLLPAIQGTVYHDCTFDEALTIAHRIRRQVQVVTE